MIEPQNIHVTSKKAIEEKSRMRKKEEKTVKWFYINCICIQVSQYNYMCI